MHIQNTSNTRLTSLQNPKPFTSFNSPLQSLTSAGNITACSYKWSWEDFIASLMKINCDFFFTGTQIFSEYRTFLMSIASFFMTMYEHASKKKNVQKNSCVTLVALQYPNLSTLKNLQTLSSCTK